MIKKDKEKGHHKKSSKSWRAYVIWESESDSSSDESSDSSVESSKILYMESKRKKKIVSHSKLESTNDLSYLNYKNLLKIYKDKPYTLSKS